MFGCRESRTPCSYSILAQALQTVHDRTRRSTALRILMFMMRILFPWILCLVASQECQDETAHLQIAKTGRPWRRWHRRHSRHYSYYHAPTTTPATPATPATTTTCLLELGPEVPDTRCFLNQEPPLNEPTTPQECAEQCQEAYGDTSGSIDFQTAPTLCRCCSGTGTLDSTEKSTYAWTKPCGGPFKPCGDRGVEVSNDPFDPNFEENRTCPDNTGFQVFTDLTDCAEECTITLQAGNIKVVSNSTHCACCKSGDTESAPGFVVNPVSCTPVPDR